MERRAISIEGIVQSVGFRPFVYNLATRLQLGGFVKNRAGGVLIEIEGDTPALECFQAELAAKPPPLARIDQITWISTSAQGDAEFHIRASDTGQSGPVFISPDIATCADCIKELFEPSNRRYRYPFLNCTNCGPRLTIVTEAPYDRSHTTMSAFTMCAKCRKEYEDPTNRRFHAQPTCCRTCGPQLRLLDRHGNVVSARDPLVAFAADLKSGQVGALKGLGGYHLACGANSPSAVTELRRRKHRDEKPFALMVKDAAAAQAICEMDIDERRLLESRQRPIVLLRKRPGQSIAKEVAPRNPMLGVMLPYTPVHYLLLQEMNGVPLVMTSGNRSDEPIACEDDDACKLLAGIADCFLTHDRPIHVRCDDSVTRIAAAAELPVRRSRGYAPQPIPLPIECPVPILAVGGQLKVTFALGRGRQAFMSHHIGDLDHYDAYRAFVRDIGLYEQLFALRPEIVVHDMHPDYASTHFAQRCNQENAVGTLFAVQHHHAHIASCMAEHGLTEPVIGVSFDGAGYGTDDAVWGGEFLVGDYSRFRRAAHLRYVGMPGGDQAIREPWRMALAYLMDAGRAENPLSNRVPDGALRAVRQMLERGVRVVPTSSMGRLFDAVASLVGVRDRVSFEGQAAMELEWLATDIPSDGVYDFDWENPVADTWIVDTRPTIRGVVKDIAKGVSPQRIARHFHSTVVAMIAAVCERLRSALGLQVVTLSGGVFMNVLLLGEVRDKLKSLGFRVYSHHLVPPNDGGLSLGQLAIAAYHLAGSRYRPPEDGFPQNPN
jgi:hydrogenase maturation protein HypF